MESFHNYWQEGWQYGGSFGRQHTSPERQEHETSVAEKEIDHNIIEGAHFSRKSQGSQSRHNTHGTQECTTGTTSHLSCARSSENQPIREHVELATTRQGFNSMTASRRQSNAQSNRLQVSNPFQYYPPDYAEPPESTLQARGIQEHDNVSDHFTHEYHVSQQAAWAYNPAEDTSAWPASQVPNNLPGLTINQPAVQPYGYNKHHPEFHEHGSNLHADQYYKQEDVVSWNPETRPGVVVNARGGQTRDTLGQLEDDLAMLDFPEPLSRNGAARFFPIQQRTQALGATMELAELMDAEPLCVTSQFFRDHSETAYLKHISQTPDREVFSSDPAFADIAESGPVTSFKDLYLRKEALKLSFESDDFASSDFRHVQQPSTCAGQKHRYQPCSKQTKDHAPPSIDQDERLASQRVTDTPEPIALSGSFGAAPMKQRQEPNDQPYYQPRDQQWLPSQATNQQQPHHDNGAYSATDIHDAQQLRSPHAQRGRPPYTDNGMNQSKHKTQDQDMAKSDPPKLCNNAPALRQARSPCTASRSSQDQHLETDQGTWTRQSASRSLRPNPKPSRKRAYATAQIHAHGHGDGYKSRKRRK